jgi:serine-threonine kinase receptor-associated protein
MLSSDGTKAVTGSADFSARVWDTVSGDMLLSLPHDHIVKAVDISASGTHIVTAGHEKKIRIFDVSKPDEPTYLTDGDSALAHETPIKAVVYNEDTQQVISADEKCMKWVNSVASIGLTGGRVWDLKTGQVAHTESFDAPLTSMNRAHDLSLISLAFGKKVKFIDPARCVASFSVHVA